MEVGIDFDKAQLHKLQKQFEQLPERVASKVNKRAVSAGGTIVARAMRSEAPVRSGTLKKSIGKKTKYYKNDNTAVAIVGPRLKKGGGFAHLVENGHVTRSGAVVPGNPFMARAVAKSEGATQARIAEKLAEGIEQEAART